MAYIGFLKTLYLSAFSAHSAVNHSFQVKVYGNRHCGDKREERE